MKNKFLKRFLLLLLAGCILAVLFLNREPEDGWASIDGQTVYYLDGQPVQGWQELEGSRYYFSEEGFLRTGWLEIGGDRYYFDETGKMHTGWLLDAHYFHPDGKLATGRVWVGSYDCNGLLNKGNYVFGADGAMLNGFETLDDGIYYLKETKAPTGFNLLKDDVKVVVSAKTVNNQSWAFNPNAALIASTEGEEYTVDIATGTASITVENNKGATLPETGGMGTTILYIVGGLLVLGAAVLLITKKRMENN